MIKRRRTREVKIGNVRIGGDNPVAIQSMTKTETADVSSTVDQINELAACGCEIIRVAIKNYDDAAAVKSIRKKIKIPLVCDIHFDYRLALKCIESGADKIRLNPGNIRKVEEIEQVVKAAKRAGIPIRIGVNSGSVSEGSGKVSDKLVGAALGYIKMFEAMNFRDIIVSLKASDVVSTIEAYRKMSKVRNYPMHLGITASGPYDYGIVKSAIGIGALLLDGIGDTIRVSLTADPAEEVIAAKRILSSLGIRRFGPDIISCPTCGRCQVDLVGIVHKFENAVRTTQCAARKSRATVAIMGCEVNGPGEAKEADIGIAFGKGSGALFKKGKIVKKVSTKEAVNELLKLL